MRFVVDTNILFSYFWKDSITYKLLMNSHLELLSPEFALEEIKKHEKEIMLKTLLDIKKLTELREELVLAIDFVPIVDYKEKLSDALSFCPDKHDVDFFALALKLKSPIWSNDVSLKKQNKITVVSTQDLLNNNEFVEKISSD